MHARPEVEKDLETLKDNLAASNEYELMKSMAGITLLGDITDPTIKQNMKAGLGDLKAIAADMLKLDNAKMMDKMLVEEYETFILSK